MPAPGNWLPFEEARLIVVAQGFKKFDDFYAWKDRPRNIPANPRSVYLKEWVGNAYFLGTGPAKETSRPQKAVAFLPFEEARTLAQRLMREYGISSQPAWNAWVKTPSKPRELPADPYKAYKGKGWQGWPAWFNTTPTRATGNEVVRSFLEARAFARTLGITESRKWYEWARTDARPNDVPYSPDTRYRDEGWMGWGDFLGIQRRWNHNSIVKFLRSLSPCIEHLTELDLYLILMRNGMLRRDQRLRGAKLLRGLMHARTAADLQSAEKEISAGLQADAADDEQSIEDEVSVEELATNGGSPSRNGDIIEALKTVDRIVELNITDDNDDNNALDFMVNERVEMLWQEAMAAGEKAVVDRLAELPEGKYSQIIRHRFEQEYYSVQSLRVPDGYRMVDARNEPVELNVMQRLTAHRLLHRSRIGNWSGVGAGKTNAATFAAAVIDARMTLILAVKSTLNGWKKTISRAFDAATVYVHDGPAMDFRFHPGRRNFVVINYDKFQLESTDELINHLCQQGVIDFIVFDEVQNLRQRHKAESRISERRRQINELIRSILIRNSDVRILAMSATPVVNNLTEAVKVLELIRPDEDFSKVPVSASIPNAIGVHFLLKRHGIRFAPRYELQLERRVEEVDGQDQYEALCSLRPRDVLQLEQTLLRVKLRHLGKWVQRGTLIYIHFVTEISEPLKQAVEEMGLRVRLCTGDERIDVEDFVKDFRAGTADVLIGSAPVGTGVDGLQFVLNRIVFMSLPWSHAEYEQIVGRVWRQGSAFEKVEIIIPQVTLTDGFADRWSWDEQRLRCIEYKESLADAALDGVIPRGGLPTPEEMQRHALEALRKWEERRSRGPSSDSERLQYPKQPN